MKNSIENEPDLRAFTSANMASSGIVVLDEDIALKWYASGRDYYIHYKYSTMLDTVLTTHLVLVLVLPHIKSNAHELWWACNDA